jgi:hypothetical protein
MSVPPITSNPKISKMAEALRTDPILHEYMKVAIKQPLVIARPVEALGEKRAYALEVAGGTVPVFYGHGPERIEREEPAKYVLFSLLMTAEVLYFRDETLDLFGALCRKVGEAYAAAGDQKPSPKKLPFETMYISSPRGFQFSENASYNSFLISTASPTGQLFVGGFNGDPTLNGNVFEIFTVSQAVVDALAIFLEERVASVQDESVPRQLRKPGTKMGLPDEKIVRVITLRDVERSAMVGPTSGSAGGNPDDARRTYHQQWLVRGHIRNQWYPSKEKHELIWVDPYVKGPEDAPLKPTVRDVRR